MNESQWTPARRIALRFFLAYAFLYVFPFPITRVLPFVPKFWLWFVPWMGANVFQISGPIEQGERLNTDGVLGYVQIPCIVILAAIATIIWTAGERKARNYDVLHDGLRVYLRYFVAHSLLFYAAVKFLKPQFPFPDLTRLDESFGESSPMALLWAFMGYSMPYSVFTGIAELLAATLLLFRRTTTLGAVITAGAMANVVMLNMSYDVPVKLYSAHLLLFAVFLMLPDLGRLAGIFVLNRATSPADTSSPLPLRGWMKPALWGAKAIVVASLFYLPLQESLSVRWERASTAQNAPLRGIYDVDDFVRNGEHVPPLTTDATRWRRAIFDPGSPLTVRTMDNSAHRYGVRIIPATSTLNIQSPKERGSFTWIKPDVDLLVLEGRMEDVPVIIRMHRVDEKQFMLVQRGFHWINSFSYMR